MKKKKKNSKNIQLLAENSLRLFFIKWFCFWTMCMEAENVPLICWFARKAAQIDECKSEFLIFGVHHKSFDVRSIFCVSFFDHLVAITLAFFFFFSTLVCVRLHLRSYWICWAIRMIEESRWNPKCDLNWLAQKKRRKKLSPNCSVNNSFNQYSLSLLSNCLCRMIVVPRIQMV